MNINNFFLFSSQFSPSIAQVQAIGLTVLKSEIDDHQKLIIGDYEGIKFPVTFKQEYGEKFGDILGTGWPDLYLISDKMKSILEKNSLKGWKLFPVNVLDKKENKILGYNGLSIVGRCGPIDYRKCEIIEKRLVPTGPIGKYYKGLHVGLDLWDGSDFFLPMDSSMIIVSSRAANLLIEANLSNASLQNLADIETSSWIVERFHTQGN